MSPIVNGTDAKGVALYFLEQTTDSPLTSMQIKKTIAQAKLILADGFTKQEICSVIDHMLTKKINMYSIGYIRAVMPDALKEIEKLILAEKGKRIREEMEKAVAVSEVKKVDESTERNREKTERFGVQSRLGKKHHFDLFEGK
jgi:hypothetical protein